MKIRLLIVATLFFVFLPVALADVVSGKVTFLKRPPFTGVVYIPVEGAPTSTGTVIELIGKKYSKPITVAFPGDKIELTGSKLYEHDIVGSDTHSNQRIDLTFDVGVGFRNADNKSYLILDWPENTLVRLGCKIHPKERSYIANIPPSYYLPLDFKRQVTTYDFRIENVPKDAQRVMLLLSKYEKLAIELKQGESKTLDLLRKGKVRGNIVVSRR